MAVMPVKAGIHGALMHKAKMDARFRGHDDREGEVSRDNTVHERPDPRRPTSATRWHRVRTRMCANGPHRARQVGEGKPAGWLARMRASFSSAQDVLSKNPVARLRTWRAGARKARPLGCPFAWLLLFGHAKRSDSVALRPKAPQAMHRTCDALHIAARHLDTTPQTFSPLHHISHAHLLATTTKKFSSNPRHRRKSP